MLTRRILLGTAAAGLAAPAILRAQGDTPIRIGEINSYTAVPAFTLPYRNGWQLAVDEINAKGGVAGRKLEVVSRDDAGQPQNATRLAGELLTDAKVDLLAGGFLSNIGLALSDFAARNGKLYVAGEPLADSLGVGQGHADVLPHAPLHLHAGGDDDDGGGQAAPAKRWVTVAPNYEYGQSAVKWFQQLHESRPAGRRVRGASSGRRSARSTPGRPCRHCPTLKPGCDLQRDVRRRPHQLRAPRAIRAGCSMARDVVSVLTGEPEYLIPLGDETPEGWLVTGYPVGQIDTPAAKSFEAAYHGPF